MMAAELLTVEQVNERRKRNDQLFRTAFATHEGRAVLEDLLDKFYRPTTIPTGKQTIDPNRVLVMSGAREVVIYILQRIELAEKNSEGMDGHSAR